MTNSALELSKQPLDVRKEFWSQLGSKIPSVQFVEKIPTLEELPEQWGSLSGVAHALISDFYYGQMLMNTVHEIPEVIREVGMLDAAFFHQNRWWAHCFLREALHEMIVSKAKDLDIFAKAYVTGSSPSTSIVLSALVRLGYKSIVLVSDEQTQSQAMISAFTKRHFEVKVDLLREADLAMQSNDGSILVNQAELVADSPWVESLSYLNFIGSAGLVVDINYPPFTHQVLEEAEVVNLRTIKGAEIRGLADWMWLKTLDPKLAISKQEYLSAWMDFAKLKNPTKV